MAELVKAAFDAEMEIAELKALVAEMLREMDRIGEDEVFAIGYYHRRCRQLGIKEMDG